MANPHRGQVNVKFGTTTYVLRFDMNAIAELEDNLEVGFAKIFDKDRVGVKVIRECLFVGLKGQHKNITREWVGKQMSFDQFEYYTTQILKAFEIGTGQKFLEEESDGDESPLEMAMPDVPLPVPELPTTTE